MPSKHQCVQCHAQFAYKSKLQRHMETHMISGDWLCGLCDTLVNRSHALVLHWRKSCPEMRNVFGEEILKKMASDELQEAAYRHTLDRCSVEEQNVLEEYEEEESDPPNLVICVYCGLSLPRGTVKNHYLVHIRRRTTGERIRHSPVPFLCDICGFGFRFRKSLLRHWRTRCSELLACAPGGEISNLELRILVEDVIRRAETAGDIDRNLVLEDMEEEGAEGAEGEGQGMIEKEEEEEEEVDDPELSPNFTAPMNPPDTADYKQKWSLQPNLICDLCKPLKFVSIGRKTRHDYQFHPKKAPKLIECELCKSKFKETRVLMMHWKDHCRSMRVEVPEPEKRKRMDLEQFREVVLEAKGRWTDLFNVKKRENLRFIERFVADLDKKRGKGGGDQMVILPVADQYVRDETTDGMDFPCSSCKAVFPNYRILRLHQQATHPQPRRTQLTVTATSLIPYFRLDTAVFYDAVGTEYRLGKLLVKDTDLAKHLKDRVLPFGSPVQLDADCFVVQLIRRTTGDNRLIVMNREEIETVCDGAGKLKNLYSESSRMFDDYPRLEKAS